MGPCLSCIRPRLDEDDYFNDENSPLIQNDNEADILAKQREAELEQRNKELNAILNSTNELLIDISTLTSPNGVGVSQPGIAMQSSQASLAQSANGTSMDYSIINNVSILDPSEVRREIERQLNDIKSSDKELYKSIEENCKIDTSNIGALVVDF